MKTFTYGNLTMDEKKKYLVSYETALSQGNFFDRFGIWAELVSAQWDESEKMLFLGIRCSKYPDGITEGYAFEREIPKEVVEHYLLKDIKIPNNFIKVLNFN